MAQLQLRGEQKTLPVTVRERELEAGRVVLRAAESGDAFLVRRAAAEVGGLEASAARRALRRVVEGVAAAEGASVVQGLLGYGAVLERHGELGWAERAYGAAAARVPADACVALHVARVARKAGRREAALARYREAARHAAGDVRMLLLVAVGEALVSGSPEQALGGVLRSARSAGAAEVVAVVREERALQRLAAGRAGAALRDLLAAAARYPEVADRIRVLHRGADVLATRGDLLAARELLLSALEHGDGATREHTLQRLRPVARALGDELELRRTRGRGATSLVILAPRPRLHVSRERSLAGRLARWRDLLAGV